jgi:hypothetical protein
MTLDELTAQNVINLLRENPSNVRALLLLGAYTHRQQIPPESYLVSCSMMLMDAGKTAGVEDADQLSELSVIVIRRLWQEATDSERDDVLARAAAVPGRLVSVRNIVDALFELLDIEGSELK